jgi:hypothetical protein
MTVVARPASMLYMKHPDPLNENDPAMDRDANRQLERGERLQRSKRRRLRLMVCLAMAAASGSGNAHEITCRPESRLECAGSDCNWITSGFQHAEFFLVDDALGTLGACLWTNCYAGIASYEDGYSSGAGIATALLQPLNELPGYAPIRVALSHDGNGRYISALFEGIDSVVLSFGQCTQSADNGDG